LGGLGSRVGRLHIGPDGAQMAAGPLNWQPKVGRPVTRVDWDPAWGAGDLVTMREIAGRLAVSEANVRRMCITTWPPIGIRPVRRRRPMVFRWGAVEDWAVEVGRVRGAKVRVEPEPEPEPAPRAKLMLDDVENRRLLLDDEERAKL